MKIQIQFESNHSSLRSRFCNGCIFNHFFALQEWWMVFWIESPVTKQETDLSAKWWFEISMCQFPWPSKLVDDKGWWSRLNISNGHHMPWRLKYDVITIYSRVQKKGYKGAVHIRKSQNMSFLARNFKEIVVWSFTSEIILLVIFGAKFKYVKNWWDFGAKMLLF